MSSFVILAKMHLSTTQNHQGGRSSKQGTKKEEKWPNSEQKRVSGLGGGRVYLDSTRMRVTGPRLRHHIGIRKPGHWDIRVQDRVHLCAYAYRMTHIRHGCARPHSSFARKRRVRRRSSSKNTTRWRKCVSIPSGLPSEYEPSGRRCIIISRVLGVTMGCLASTGR